jgi:hypothetical protein
MSSPGSLIQAVCNILIVSDVCFFELSTYWVQMILIFKILILKASAVNYFNKSQTFKGQWFLYVPRALTLHSPHSVFVRSVPFSQETATASLNTDKTTLCNGRSVSLIFSMSRFALSYEVNICIFMILYFCFLPA